MIANLITGSRIILSLVMLPFTVFSVGFYICYLLAGFTDMVDGTIARKLGTESEFGKNMWLFIPLPIKLLVLFCLFCRLH